MDGFDIGLLGIGSLFVLMLLRMPIAIALGLVSIAGIAVLRSDRAATGLMGAMPYDFAANWTLSAIPMFLFMGSVAFNTGMTSAIYRLFRMAFWWVPGGLALTTNWASTAFGVVCGSSVAVTAMMSRVAIPEMLKHRYSPSLATSVVAASGTVDSLIPPSIAFIIYAWYAEIPVTELFMAGILPGLLTSAVYTVIIVGRCLHDPELGPRGERDFTPAELRHTAVRSWPIPVLFLGIFGGLYSGLMTVTEAAAGSAFIACLIALVRGELTFRSLRTSLVESSLTTASLFFVVIGAAMFARFMAVSGVPRELGALIEAMDVSVLGFMLIVGVVYLVLGMFLDGIGVMMLTLPILLPICDAMEIDLVWMGVVVVKLILLGLITPPVGLQAFVVKGVVGDAVPLTTIFGGLLWFVAAEIVIIVLLVAFPEISLWLPSLIGG